VNARVEVSPADRAALLEAPTLTLPQTAKVLGVGLTGLRDALRKDDGLALPVISVGSRKVVASSAIRRFLGEEL
jgi:hypothetical protein